MRPPEPADVNRDVREIPAEPVQAEQCRQRRDTGRGRVGVQDGSVAGVEVPQVTFGRRDTDGVPVDEQPAPVRCEHRVAGMRLAVGEHRPARLGPRRGRQLVVPAELSADCRRVLADESRRRASVRPAVGDRAARAGSLKLVPELHREIVGGRMPPRPGRRRVHRGHHGEHPEPVLSGVPLVPCEAPPGNERVDRDREPLAQPRHRLPVVGRSRCYDEPEAGVLQVDGRAQRRPQPGEAIIQGLAVALPFGLELIDGDEPPRPASIGDFPVMTAPPDRPVGHRRDADSPARTEPVAEGCLVQIVRRRQHAATVRLRCRADYRIIQ